MKCPVHVIVLIVAFWCGGTHALVHRSPPLRSTSTSTAIAGGTEGLRLRNYQQTQRKNELPTLSMSERGLPNVSKQALVDAIAQKAGVSKKTAAIVLGATLDVIVESVCDGHKVSLVGFGSFQSKLRPEREVRNPKTGDKIHVPAVRDAKAEFRDHTLLLSLTDALLISCCRQWCHPSRLAKASRMQSRTALP